MNKQLIELMGHIVERPEIRSSKDKKKFAKMCLAVNDVVKDVEGKEIERVTFYNLLLFGKRVEICKKLKKGSLLRTVGKLSSKPYLSKKGEPKVDLTVFVDEFNIL